MDELPAYVPSVVHVSQASRAGDVDIETPRAACVARWFPSLAPSSRSSRPPVAPWKMYTEKKQIDEK